METKRNSEEERLFDPATLRDAPDGTSYCQSLMHLLKGVIGTGIFAIPYAYKNCGLFLGTIGMLLISVVCNHCAYIIVSCAHKFYFYTKQPSMTYSEVADYAFTHGPERAKKYATFFSILVSVNIFLTYWGTCSVYGVLISETINELLLEYWNIKMHIRVTLLLMILPFIVIVWVPNLKILAPFSAAANFFILIVVSIAFYYFLSGIPNDFGKRKQIRFVGFPGFLANAIFAVDPIGAVMPLENKMKKPKQFLGCNGVLVIGAVVCVSLYTAFGIFGYLRYGEDIHGSILLKFPTKQIPVQIMKMLVLLDVYVAFAFQMYIAYDAIWVYIKNRVTQKVFVNYILRTVLTIGSILVSIGVPLIAPFMALIGAFCFSMLGIVLPCIIEIIINWEAGTFGKYNWMLYKNIILIMFGMFLLIFGTFMSIIDINKQLKDV